MRPGSPDSRPEAILVHLERTFPRHCSWTQFRTSCQMTPFRTARDPRLRGRPPREHGSVREREVRRSRFAAVLTRWRCRPMRQRRRPSRKRREKASRPAPLAGARQGRRTCAAFAVTKSRHTRRRNCVATMRGLGSFSPQLRSFVTKKSQRSGSPMPGLTHSCWPQP
jgi:hypothetical protein